VAALNPATVLTRAAELEVRVTAAGDVVVVTDRGLVSGGPHCLAILDLFSEPTTLADALERLGSRAGGGQDWIDLSAAIVRLAGAGVLRARDELETEPGRVVGSSFDSPSSHVAMLEDRVRTSAFLAALAELVRPDDVVVDIGTGTGILAMGAARAGARHVYAIEATPLGRQAREVVEANGLGDRVTVVEGWSTRVTLPERGTLVVAEILGSDALEERALPVLLDARRRLLAPEARLVPGRIRIFGLPVAVPQERLDNLMFTRANTARWSEWYGLELGGLTDYTARLRQRLTVNIEEVRSWPSLSEPVLLAELDLAGLDSPMVEAVVEATATASGEADGVTAFFEADLSPGVTISTSPVLADPPMSWGLPVWLAPRPAALRRGETFRLEYTYTGVGGRVRLVP
jgi:type I protein arginine methyltransferase